MAGGRPEEDRRPSGEIGREKGTPVETKIIEATNGPQNWGKFMLGRPDIEWERRSAVDTRSTQPLMRLRGWSPAHLWVLDLETGEGAFFRPGGSAAADLRKHRIWVCPLFEPFLEWLYQQNLSDLSTLPDIVNLPQAPFAMSGYRRPGPDHQDDSIP